MVEKTFWKTILGIFLFCLMLFLYLEVSGVIRRAGLGSLGFMFFPGIPLILSGFALIIGVALFLGRWLERRISREDDTFYRLPGNDLVWIFVVLILSWFLMSYLVEVGSCLSSDQLLVSGRFEPRGHWVNCLRVMR